MSEGSTCKHCNKLYVATENDADGYCSFDCRDSDICKPAKKKELFDIQIPLVVKNLKTA